MRTLEQIARRPEDGDVVLMQDGHVRYRVTALTLRTGVRLVRTSVRTGEPDASQEVRQELSVPLEAWRDLVFYGAASCRHVRGRAARGGDS